MRNIIGLLLLTVSTSIAQDKGKFEIYSNPFYGKIISESNQYLEQEKEEEKSFKMNFDGKEIPKKNRRFYNYTF